MVVVKDVDYIFYFGGIDIFVVGEIKDWYDFDWLGV